MSKEKQIVASTRISPELSEKIDRLGEALDRSRAWILKQAIENYVSKEAEFLEFLKEGEDAIKSDDFVTHEEFIAEITARKSQRKHAA